METPRMLKAPVKVSPDVQVNLLELAVLKASLDRVSSAYQRKQAEIAGKLVAAVEVVAERKTVRG
jgi:hypothetical protein